VFKRDKWEDSHGFVGHTAPVVAARPNPRMFHAPQRQGGALMVRGTPGRRSQEGGAAAAANGNGSVAVSDEPTVVTALCSLDKQFSVWASVAPQAVMVGSHVSKLGIMDAAWTPDGYSLVVVSLDGSIVTCRWVGWVDGWGGSFTDGSSWMGVRYGSSEYRL